MESREKEPRKGLLEWIRWWWNDTPKDLEEQIRMIRKYDIISAALIITALAIDIISILILKR